MSERRPSWPSTVRPPRHRSLQTMDMDLDHLLTGLRKNPKVVVLPSQTSPPIDDPGMRQRNHRLRNWVLLLPTTVWTVAIIVIGVYGSQVGILAVLIALATSAVVAAMSVLFALARSHREQEHAEVLAFCSGVNNRLDMIEAHLPAAHARSLYEVHLPD